MTFLGRDSLGILREYSATQIDTSSASMPTFLGRDANGILRDYSPASLDAAAATVTVVGRDDLGRVRSYTATEINAAYTEATYLSTILATSPVDFWRLGESSGTTAANLVGATAGTYEGTHTKGVAGVVAGNTAVAFAGGDVAIGPNRHFGALHSIVLWYRRTTIDTEHQVMLGKGSDQPQIGFYDDSLIVSYGGAPIVGGGSHTDDDWHMLAYVHASNLAGGQLLYLDGVDVSTAQGAATAANNASWLVIGTDHNGANPFTGDLDEVAIWDRVLSPAEIAAIYAARSL